MEKEYLEKIIAKESGYNLLNNLKNYLKKYSPRGAKIHDMKCLIGGISSAHKLIGLTKMTNLKVEELKEKDIARQEYIHYAILESINNYKI